MPALGDNNLKVVQGALGTLAAVVDALEEDFAPFLGGLWAPLVERMGDAKAPVRERAAARRRGGDARGAAGARARSAAAGVRAPQLARARVGAPLPRPHARGPGGRRPGGGRRRQGVHAARAHAARGPRAARPRGRRPRPRAGQRPHAFGATRRNFGAILSAHLPRARPRRRTATLATSSSTTCAAATCGRRSSSRCSSASASAAGARPRARRGTAATATAIGPTLRSGPRRRRICRCGRRAPAPAAACRVTAVARRRRWTRARRWSRRWCTRSASFPKRWRAWVSC